MTETLSTILIAFATSGITGFFTWLFTRRKYNEEVDSSKIENLQKSLDFYVRLSDDTNKRLTEILTMNESLEKQVSELRAENAEFKKLVEKQNEHITALTSQIAELKSAISNAKVTRKTK